MHHGTLVSLSLLVLAGSAAAQGYPNKVVKLQVPFALGGTTDIIARVISEPLGKALEPNVIVEHEGDGGGAVGANEATMAVPDGYSLGMGTVSTTAANPAINPKTPYNPLTDFTPLINIAASPDVISVHPSVSAKDDKAFVAELKKNPGKHSYASSGAGGIGRLQSELWKGLQSVFITHIPSAGAGPALRDTVGGQVEIIFDNVPSAMPHFKNNRLIPLAVAAPQQLTALPNVSTFEELGLELVNRMACYGILSPKGLPKDMVDIINAATRKALQDPAVRKRIEDTGSVVLRNTPEQFAAQMRGELAVYQKVVKTARLKLV